MAHTPTNPYEPHSHARAAGEHDPHHQKVGHLVSPKVLIATAAALLVLTVVTVKAAAFDFAVFEMREMNIFIAMGIAVLKASLVCLFFMHLRWDRSFNAFVLVMSLLLVGLFISFAMTDRSEYAEELIRGESTVIQNKLAESPAVTPAPAAAEAAH